MNLKFSFVLFDKLYGFSFATKPYLKQYMYGFTNRCIDGKYIICLDYDRMNLEWILPEIRQLQNNLGLSTFYIFESSPGSYWAVCLTKVSFKHFVDIIRSTSCDDAYKTVPLYYGKKLWTLRLSDKNGIAPKLIHTMVNSSKDTFLNRKLSLAHYKLLKKIYPNIKCLTSDLKRFDDNLNLICSSYGAEKNNGGINNK